MYKKFVILTILCLAQRVFLLYHVRGVERLLSNKYYELILDCVTRNTAMASDWQYAFIFFM